MKLFIANCSPYRQQFKYRLPEAVRPVLHDIRPGGVLCLDHGDEDARCIIRQHERYGLVHVKKLPPRFDGLCWSEREISVSALRNGREQYAEAVDARSEESTSMEILAADRRMARIAEENGAPPPAEGLEVTIESQTLNGEPDRKPVRRKLKVRG